MPDSISMVHQSSLNVCDPLITMLSKSPPDTNTIWFRYPNLRISRNSCLSTLYGDKMH
jgi:hypothetical protein